MAEQIHLLKALLKNKSLDLSTLEQVAQGQVPKKRELKKISKNIAKNPALASAVQQLRSGTGTTGKLEQIRRKKRRQQQQEEQEDRKQQITHLIQQSKKKKKRYRHKLRKLEQKMGQITLDQYLQALNHIEFTLEHQKIVDLYLQQQEQEEQELHWSD